MLQSKHQHQEEVIDLEYDMLYNKPSPEELYHHGILGMKWGIRRYQNKDGTLTEAGKKRLGEAQGKARDGNETSSTSQKKEKSPHIQKTMKSKQLKKMPDEDLNASTERLKREAEYKRLMNEVYGDQFSKDMKSQISRGVSEAVGNTAKKLTNVATVKGVNALAKALGYQGDLIGLDDNSDGINKALRGVYKNIKDLGQDVKKKTDEAKNEEKKTESTTVSKKKESSNSKKKTDSKSKPEYADAETVYEPNYKKSSNTERYSGTVEGTGTSRSSIKNGYSKYRQYADQTIVYSESYIEDGRRYLEDKFQYPAVR